MNNSNHFYCLKKKMNQPVLLPDGRLSLCSFDYALRLTYGNLFEEKLSHIRKEWELKVGQSFSKGGLSPCTECEFYVPT